MRNMYCRFILYYLYLFLTGPNTLGSVCYKLYLYSYSKQDKIHWGLCVIESIRTIRYYIYYTLKDPIDVFFFSHTDALPLPMLWGLKAFLFFICNCEKSTAEILFCGLPQSKPKYSSTGSHIQSHY